MCSSTLSHPFFRYDYYTLFPNILHVIFTQFLKAKIGTEVHDFDWLKSNLELEKIKFNNGELNGLDEQLNMLKENKPFLFALEQKKPEITGVTPAKTWEESKPQDAFLANLV